MTHKHYQQTAYCTDVHVLHFCEALLNVFKSGVTHEEVSANLKAQFAIRNVHLFEINIEYYMSVFFFFVPITMNIF